MKTLIVFALCLGASLACNPLQQLLVKAEWAQVFGFGLDREIFGNSIWRRMYQVDPETPKLFARVNGDDIYSPKFTAHSYRVLGGLDMAITLLNDEADFNAQMAQLNMQHKERGITNIHFENLRSVVLELVPTLMGRGFHDTNAWRLCLRKITDGIEGK